MSTMSVSARGLCKAFGAVKAVRSLTLDVPEGACFGLIGANGAGKTTFIKMLLGITRPDSGDISVLGGSPEDVRVRAQVGYLPERLSIPEAFSPVRFLASVARIKGMTDAGAVDQETHRVLELVQLERAAWRRATGGFSKGMKQRTGLAAALLGKPRLLVLDEPTDGIDPIGRAQIRDVIRAAVEAGSTVFLNSHLLAETEKICDHVAILAGGHVVTSGALDVLKRRDASRVRFVRAERDVERAAVHGFAHLEDHVSDGHARTFRFESQDPASLSRALYGALADGLMVIDVVPELKDLETILKEAVLT